MSSEVKSIQYPVMETFFSVQGEGYFQGHAAFFVRLAGCDVGCVWCDVKESWDAGQHTLRSVQHIVDEVVAASPEIVIVTGGEPLIYDCQPLTVALHNAGLRVHLETSGAYPLSGDWDWICVSPKKFKPPLADVLAVADELKSVIYHKSDIKWAEKHTALVPEHCKLYLQPEWSREREMLPLITEFVKQNPRYALSLQLHKYIGVR